MKGIDTNVLVRYLVQDDPAQSRAATSFIEGTTAEGEKLYLCSVVLCELAWVLESAYKIGKREIAETLEKILMTGAFELEHRDAAWAALSEFRSSKTDFPDCIIGRIHQEAGCETTVTFDRAALALTTFSPP